MSGHSFQGRPDSELLTDLAVFIVPPELWRENLHSAISGIDAISAGFLRIHPETVVTSLRDEIETQLSEDFEIPQNYVFLKNVGKCLTKVRHKQENVLKVKNFVPPGPSSFVPEIYLLEGGSDTMSIHPSSVSSSYRGEDPYKLQSYRGKNAFSSQKPIPPIQTGGDEFSTNHAIPQGKNPLTSSMDSVRSNISQRLGKSLTDSTSSLNSTRSNGSTKNGVNNQSKAVSFYAPIQESDPNRFYRTPTPRNSEILDNSTDSLDKSTQFSSNDKAIQASGSFIMSNQNNKSSNNNSEIRDNNPNTAGRQNGYSRSNTPPLHSATSPLGISPVPDKRIEREPPPLPPLSATPPLTNSPGPGGYSDYSKQNGYQPAEDSSRWETRDSGPDSDELRRQAEEAERQRREDLAERQRREDLAERQRRALEERRNREEQLRRKKEEEDRLKREEDERRIREEEEAQRLADEEEMRRRRQMEEEEDEEERRRTRREDEEEQRRRGLDEERKRRMEEEERRRREEEKELRRRMEEEERAMREGQRRDKSPRTGSEQEKQTLLEELKRLRAERQETERQREDLVKRAKQLQSKTQNRRNQARDIWKKKYFDEKKKSPPLEEQVNKLRQELESIHRRIVNTMEGSKGSDGKRLPPDRPSPQSNVKIQAARLQHEIEDLQRRVETVKMKLTAEMKLRNQAEVELRALRAELTQKKINVTLARSKAQQQSEELYTARSQPPPLTSRT